MKHVMPGLHATEPHDLGFGQPPLQARSYVIERPDGNLSIYGPGPILADAESVRQLGGLSKQYLNHAHEASAEADLVTDRFGAPLLVHWRDAEEVSEVATVGGTFADRHRENEDFEVIPIPGHTPGATAFLWRGLEARVLFTGDSVSLLDGEWRAAFLDATSDRADYVASLELLAGLEFDLLAAGIAPIGQPFTAATNPAESKELLLGIAARLRAGGDR